MVATKARKSSANGKPRRSKQQMIPGSEPEKIPEVTAVAEEYLEALEARMHYGRLETAAGEKLLGLLHKHGLKSYETGAELVSIKTLEKVRVRRKKEKDLEDSAE